MRFSVSVRQLTIVHVLYVGMTVSLIFFGGWYLYLLLNKPDTVLVSIFELDGSLPLPLEFKSLEGIKVLNVYQDDCPCNGFLRPQVRTITKQFNKAKVHFFRADSAQTEASTKAPLELRHMPTIDRKRNKALFQYIPNSPALIIWDSYNQLSYFGPYDTGPNCESSNSFIGNLINELLNGASARAISTVGVGCFCSKSAM